MEDKTADQPIASNTNKVFLPGSKLILILGISSIAACWLYGITGLALGLWTLSLVKTALSTHQQQQRTYNERALKTIKEGRIYAIIGVSLSSVYLILWFIKIIG